MTVAELAAMAIIIFIGIVATCVAGVVIIIGTVYAAEGGAWFADKAPDLMSKVVAFILAAIFTIFFLVASYGIGLSIIEWVGEVVA